MFEMSDFKKQKYILKSELYAFFFFDELYAFK